MPRCTVRERTLGRNSSNFRTPESTSTTAKIDAEHEEFDRVVTIAELFLES